MLYTVQVQLRAPQHQKSNSVSFQLLLALVLKGRLGNCAGAWPPQPASCDILSASAKYAFGSGHLWPKCCLKAATRHSNGLEQEHRPETCSCHDGTLKQRTGAVCRELQLPGADPRKSRGLHVPGSGTRFRTCRFQDMEVFTLITRGYEGSSYLGSIVEPPDN